MNVYRIAKPIYKGLKSVYGKLKEKKHRFDVVNGNHTVVSVEGKRVADHRREGFSLVDSYCYDLIQNDYHDYISSWEESQPDRGAILMAVYPEINICSRRFSGNILKSLRPGR